MNLLLSDPAFLSVAATISGGGGIVTNGLVLNLDAGDPSSYPGTGTTWTDLSGNGNNGTLINGPTYSSANGGSLSFDGSNDYAIIAASSDFVFNSDFSVEAWAYPTNTTNKVIYTNNMDGEWSSQGNSFHIDTARIQVSANGSINFGTPLAANAWSHVALVRIGSSLVFYRNAIAEITLSNSVTFGNGSNTPGIGLLDTLGGAPREFFSGSISIVRVLKGKGLTAAEVTQNYNALKGRYGL